MSQLGRIATVLVALGMGLLVLGLLWPSVARQSIVWSEADAKEHATAAADLHSALHGYAGPTHAEAHEGEHEEHAAPANDTELAAARERFDSSQSRLQTARTARSGVAWLLRWVGIAVAFCGAGLYVVMRAQGAV
jgi:hypothetical protein